MHTGIENKVEYGIIFIRNMQREVFELPLVHGQRWLILNYVDLMVYLHKICGKKIAMLINFDLTEHFQKASLKNLRCDSYV